MIRLITFFVVLVIMGLLLLRTWKSGQSGFTPPSTPSAVPKQIAKPKAKKSALSDELWMQVYDSETIEEARKIQRKFYDADIPCLVYQQGKKDVYGERLKHYGISVPKNLAETAQNLLAKIVL